MQPMTLMRSGMRAVIASAILSLLFASGVATGLLFYPAVFSVADDTDGHDHHDDAAGSGTHSHEPDDHDEEDHVALTEQAFANLSLQLGQPTRGDYWKSILVPGKVVEIPGRSNLAISSPVTGVIENVEVIPGETLALDSNLFTIRVTDEALLAAQVKYLETLTQRDVAEQEIARLSPLIDSGVASGAKRRELEYEVRQIETRQATLLQELRGRGLPERHLADLQQHHQLVTELAITAPKFVGEYVLPNEACTGYSIETLLIYPGKTVSRGDSLCTVAFHRELYLEGTAFEMDLPVLEKIVSNGWLITAESDHDSDHEASDKQLGLKLLRVDNHVYEDAQTVRFFAALPNEVQQCVERNGRRFEQWRFRPGQRMHLRLPVEHWQDQLTLPADAVVVDGPNVFVFAEHHDDDHDEEDDIFIEFEPVPVRVLHRDDKSVVIADDGQFHADEQIALNNAYKLYLAMKVQAGGGGGHHHDHDH